MNRPTAITDTLVRTISRPTLTRLVAAVALAACTAGCAPLLIGGAMVGGGLVVTDRRTTGTQVEDQSIELKAASRVGELATLGHVNAVSYNRVVLLTGEVPTEADKARVGDAVARIENVKKVVNEIGVLGNSSVGSRSNDTLLGAKVKATLVDTKDVQANAYKVVVERGVVYLMGRVSEREATRGAEIASSVAGVQKVVRVFELLTEQELAALGRTPAAAPAASAAR
jgi:osmotically-inducible protein OsmY